MTVDVYLSTILATQTSCYGQFDEVHAECEGCDLAILCQVSSKAKPPTNANTCVDIDWSPHTVSSGNYPIDHTIADVMREVIASNLRTDSGRFTGTRPTWSMQNVPIAVETTVKDWIPLTYEFKGVTSYKFKDVPSWVTSTVAVQCAEEPDPQITTKPKTNQ